MVRPRMSQVPNCIDTFIQYADVTNDRNIKGFYEHFRILRELIIRQQYQCGKRFKLESFFKPIPASSISRPINPNSPTLAQSPSTAQPHSPHPSTSSAQEATRSASEDINGLFDPLCISTVRPWQKKLLSTTQGKLNLNNCAIF